MVRPSPVLQARLRLSAKRIGRGFYRGNRVGSTGAHTQYGGYIIDWRKVKNYNVPDLAGFNLTPYVTREINAKDVDHSQDYASGLYTEHDDAEASMEGEYDAQPDDQTLDTLQKKMMRHLTRWRNANPAEFDRYVRYQYEQRVQAQPPHAEAEGEEQMQAAEEEMSEILSKNGQKSTQKQDQTI